MDLVGSTNFLDYAKSDQHVHTMKLFRKEQALAQGVSVAAYALIAQSFNSLSEDECRMLRVKFNIAYFVTTEQLAFHKYPRICKLKARHGVNPFSSYLHKNAGKDYIAE